MADKKISQLTAVSTPLAGTEVLPIVQSGATKKVTALELTGVNVTSDGRVGVGGVPDATVNGSPITAKFGVHQDGGSTNYPVVGAVKYSDVTSAAGVTICGARGRGSQATPTVVANGDLLSSHIAAGYDGTDFAISSRINYEVDGTPGNDDMPGRVVFLTSPDGSQTPIERARIDSSGNLLVGCTTSPVSSRTKGFCALSNSSGGIKVYQATSNSDWAVNSIVGSVVNFYSDNGSALVYAGSIIVNGNVTTYGSVSDYRVKENVQPITGALNRIKQLNPVAFTFTGNGQNSEGFIAHELAAVIPNAVTGEKDAVDAENKPIYQTVDASALVVTLTAALQETVAKIELLTDRITRLENQ